MDQLGVLKLFSLKNVCSKKIFPVNVKKLFMLKGLIFETIPNFSDNTNLETSMIANINKKNK